VNSLGKHCSDNKVGSDVLEAQLDSWEGAGHFTQLKCKVDEPQSGSQQVKHLTATGCFAMDGNTHLTLKSPAVKGAVEYSQQGKEKFMEDQQKDGACLKFKVMDTSNTKEEKEDPERKEKLKASLLIHSVALMQWRLQNVQGLTQHAALAGWNKQLQGQQQDQSDARMAFGCVALGI
jgi:hypothetical protein